MRAVRAAFEVLSCVFVVTALLTAVYSEHRWLRAVAGLAMIALVSTVTASLVLRAERRRGGQ